MNGITNIALAVICVYIIYYAIRFLNKISQTIAKEQGKRRALEWRAMQQRLSKSGEFNVNEGWK